MRRSRAISAIIGAVTHELLVRQGGREWRYALNTGSVHIGRGSQNDVSLHADGVSRVHARLDLTLDGWRLTDLDSTNGTRVNGSRVTQAAVGPADVIEIGRAELRLAVREETGGETTVLEATMVDTADDLDQALNALPLDVAVPDTSRARVTVRFDGRVWEAPLGGDGLTIGRDAANDLVLNHGRVSRRHARIERSGDGAVLVDLGSANGTLVNGEKAARRELDGTETIRIGPAALVFKPAFKPNELVQPPAGSRAPARRPIVFVPGFMGSQLWHGERMVWPNLRLLMTQPELFRLPEAQPLRADGLVDEVVVVPNLYAQEQYSQLSDFLQESFGYEPGQDYLPFAYDWRRDLRLAATQLKARVETWREALPDPRQKFILIAHSMGCLVSRYFLDVLGGDALVERVILMGGPQQGTPKAVLGLLTGKGLLPFGLLGDKMRDTIATFPAAYQLLPTYPAVFDQDGKQVDIFADPRWADTPYREYVVDAKRFRMELSPAARLPTLCVVGYGNKTVTRAKVSVGADGRWDNIQFTESDEGDSTIPVDSALLDGAEFHPVQQRHGALFADNDVKFRLRRELMKA